jgi:hypothetical protein
MIRMLVALALVGCSTAASPSAQPPALPNYELDCRASNTATAAELFCVRTDTRNGSIVRVLHGSLPVSNGPTAASAAEAPGTYTTVCDATSTTTRSDLYCIRMNTRTGDMMLVNLQKIESIPTSKP